MEKFTSDIIRLVVAQTGQAMGFHSAMSLCMDVVEDLTKRYMRSICDSLHRATEHAGRSEPILDDVQLAFLQVGVNVAELSDFIQHTAAFGERLETPKVPIPCELRLNMPPLSADELYTRDEAIPWYLPLIKPPSTSQENEPQAAKLITTQTGVLATPVQTVQPLKRNARWLYEDEAEHLAEVPDHLDAFELGLVELCRTPPPSPLPGSQGLSTSGLREIVIEPVSPPASYGVQPIMKLQYIDEDASNSNSSEGPEGANAVREQRIIEEEGSGLSPMRPVEERKHLEDDDLEFETVIYSTLNDDITAETTKEHIDECISHVVSYTLEEGEILDDSQDMTDLEKQQSVVNPPILFPDELARMNFGDQPKATAFASPKKKDRIRKLSHKVDPTVISLTPSKKKSHNKEIATAVKYTKAHKQLLKAAQANIEVATPPPQQLNLAIVTKKKVKKAKEHLVKPLKIKLKPMKLKKKPGRKSKKDKEAMLALVAATAVEIKQELDEDKELESSTTTAASAVVPAEKVEAPVVITEPAAPEESVKLKIPKLKIKLGAAPPVEEKPLTLTAEKKQNKKSKMHHVSKVPVVEPLKVEIQDMESQQLSQQQHSSQSVKIEPVHSYTESVEEWGTTPVAGDSFLAVGRRAQGLEHSAVTIEMTVDDMADDAPSSPPPKSPSLHSKSASPGSINFNPGSPAPRTPSASGFVSPAHAPASPSTEDDAGFEMTFEPGPMTSAAVAQAAPVQRKTTSTDDEPPLFNLNAPSMHKEIWICPACGVPYNDGDDNMICCDKCDNWFHWACVGLSQPPPDDELWYCEKCALTVKKVKKRGPKSKGTPVPKASASVSSNVAKKKTSKK